MKKRAKNILIVAGFLFMFFTINVVIYLIGYDTFMRTSGIFVYKATLAGEATIVSLTEEGQMQSEIVIPSEIKGKTIVAVELSNGWGNVVTVNLPKTVKRIDLELSVFVLK